MVEETTRSRELKAAVLTAEQQVALAWLHEEGARYFYRQLSDAADHTVYRELFAELAADEEGHKRTLLALYEGLTKQKPAVDFPAGVLPDDLGQGVMEGDLRIADLLAKLRRGDPRAACDLAVRIEKTALERYQHLQQSLEDENSRRVFEVLVIEERRHLRKLDLALEALSQPGADNR